MANEPERPIEKLLRAAAKKRRDEAGAPFELHPATRRLLQGEVARKFAKAPRQARSFSERLGRWWPRFAWGAALFAVLGVAAWMLVPALRNGKPEALLARNEPVPEAAPAKEPPPPPPAPVTAAPQEPAAAKIAASGGVPAPAPAGTIGGDYQRRLGVASKLAPPAGVPAAPAAPPPAAMPPTAPADAAADESSGLAGAKVSNRPPPTNRSPP